MSGILREKKKYTYKAKEIETVSELKYFWIKFTSTESLDKHKRLSKESQKSYEFSMGFYEKNRFRKMKQKDVFIAKSTKSLLFIRREKTQKL